MQDGLVYVTRVEMIYGIYAGGWLSAAKTLSGGEFIGI